MDEKSRLYIYAFLSRAFSEAPDEKMITDMKANRPLLETIGEETAAWFLSTPVEALEEALNVDYHSLFAMNNHPIESAVMDSKNEILVGLQNPVMQFYFSHGYDLNLESSKLYVPDHAGIEFGFMQSLVQTGEATVQRDFLARHLLRWLIPFLTAIKETAQTPFYRDLCDFTVEFLLADYSALAERIGHE